MSFDKDIQKEYDEFLQEFSQSKEKVESNKVHYCYDCDELYSVELATCPVHLDKLEVIKVSWLKSREYRF